jgi:Tfp pilus assembly protein PilV
MTRSRTGGYTVVELMMALAVFATGVTGIIAMERATVQSNQFAKNLTTATGVAQSWLSQLAVDTTQWPSSSDVTGTAWLSTIAGSPNVWQLPTYNATRGFGAQFDGFGVPVNANGVFCAHIRLTWLNGDASAVQPSGDRGNGLIRTEVRVFWPRDGVTRVPGDCNDAAQATVTAVETSTGIYHFVTLAGAVRQPG